MTMLTPAQRIYRAAEAAGVLVDGAAEARTDHAAVAAEVRAREEAGLRVDDSIRTQLRAKYTTAPMVSLSFERRAWNPQSGEYVAATDLNALANFTKNLEAQAIAGVAGATAAAWGPEGARNDAAREIDEQAYARWRADQAAMARMNAHLPPGVPAR